MFAHYFDHDDSDVNKAEEVEKKWKRSGKEVEKKWTMIISAVDKTPRPPENISAVESMTLG